MPIYDFKCAKCGNAFDALVPASAAKPAAACPQCGSKRTRRLLSKFSVGGGRASPSGSANPSCAPSG